jgi:hypothetical protein
MSDFPGNTFQSDNNLCVRFSKDTISHDDTFNNLTMRRRHIFTQRQINLEMHQLIWLDPNFSMRSNVNVESLRNIVDYTKIFDNSENCVDCIKQTQDTNTFLVCTEELAHEFIPRIHNLKHILKIYVISQPENHQKMFSCYSKV